MFSKLDSSGHGEEGYGLIYNLGHAGQGGAEVNGKISAWHEPDARSVEATVEGGRDNWAPT